MVNNNSFGRHKHSQICYRVLLKHPVLMPQTEPEMSQLTIKIPFICCHERNVRLTTVDILNRVGLISGLQKQIFYHHSYNFGHKDKVCVLCVAGPIKDKRCSSIILGFQHLTMCLLVLVVQRAARTR